MMKPKYKVGDILIPKHLSSNVLLPMDIIALIKRHEGCKFKVEEVVKVSTAFHSWYEYHLVKESVKREKITISDMSSDYFKKKTRITFKFK